MLPIAVEIAPPDAHKDQVAALLSACSRAVAESECVLAAEAPEGGAAAVAIVTWQSDGQAFVEVGMRRDGRPQWRSRNVSFASEDEPIERWRTVGFVLGTLARSELTGENPPEPAPSGEPVRPTPPAAAVAPDTGKARPSPSVRMDPAQAAIDVGAELGPALASGLRSGGVLRTRWPFQEPLRVVAALKYLEQNNSTPAGRWLTAGVGLGWVHGTARAEVSGAADARVEYFETKYEDYGTIGGMGTRHSRWLAGLGLNVTAAWMPMPTLGLFVSGDAAWMFGYTQIHLRSGEREVEVVTDKPLRFGAGGGVRLRLW
ncbi:MAG: hypothetical protein QM756_13485 [Polyangiaceae bacterium]